MSRETDEHMVDNVFSSEPQRRHKLLTGDRLTGELAGYFDAAEDGLPGIETEELGDYERADGRPLEE